MKITFACEKCGYEFGTLTGTPRKCEDGRSNALYLENCVKTDQCPRCDSLTYGPLTVEMVAEALCEARTFHDDSWLEWEGAKDNADVYAAFLVEARFVLRLMQTASEKGRLYWDAEGAKRELLDLARKP